MARKKTETLLRGSVYSIVNVGFDMRAGYDERSAESANAANTCCTKVGTVKVLWSAEVL